ncbi:MAG: Sensor histidine kinase RcsC [Phycisphaerae bacterium]|nr:Sensor histidine kinase RcsC [Phycisphaerae bacterium]
MFGFFRRMRYRHQALLLTLLLGAIAPSTTALIEFPFMRELIIFSVVIIFYFFARRVDRPISQLVRSSRELAGGGYSGPLPVRGPALEFAELVESYNWMAEQVRARVGAQEAAISETEARTRAIVKTAVDAIITFTLDGRIESFNPSAVQMFGYTEKEALGRDIRELLPDAFEMSETVLTASLSGDARRRPETDAVRKDGSRFPVELTTRTARVGSQIIFVVDAWDITHRRQAENALRASERRLRIQNQALIELAGLEPTRGDVGLSLRQITEVAARTLETERVSVWLFDRDRTRIDCQDLFQRHARRHESGAALRATDGPAYFRALTDERVIAADDAERDPRTREFADNYLRPLRIVSLLDAPIRVGGKMIGVMCCEHVGNRREWQVDEQVFASAAADLAALVFESQERLRAEEEQRIFVSLVENSSDLIGMADTDGRPVYLNEAGRRMIDALDLPADGLHRLHLLDLYHESVRPFMRQTVLPAVQTRGQWEGELKLRRLTDGKPIDVLSTILVLRDPHTQEAIRTATVTHDITERKRFEADLAASKERLQLAFDATNDAIWDWDVAAQEMVVNQRFHELNDMKDMSFESWRDCVHPDDWPAVARAFDDQVAGRTTSFEMEYRQRGRGLRWNWILARGKVVQRDPDGKPVRIVGTHSDITARKSAEEERQKLVAVVENSNEFIGLTTLDLAPLFLNEAGRNLLGFASMEAALAAPLREWFAPESWQEVEHEAIPRAISAGLWAGELRVQRCTTCDTVDVEASLFTVRSDRTGEPICVAYVMRDISERQRRMKAEAEREAAEAANMAKSTFLANISHELRTPLNAILGYSEMLQEEVQELGQTGLVPDLQRIHTAGRHLLDLINDILDLSKIEAGRMQLYLEEFDAASVLGEVVSTIEPLVQKNRNTLTADLPAGLGRVFADVTKVRQILFNLLSNAAKFTEDGSIRLTARRETGADRREWIELSVADTGIGIAPEKIEALFREFTQADPSTTRKYGGTGLGLAISRRFCQLMGGDVTATSAPGKGSTFVARIPARVSPPSPVAPAAPTVAPRHVSGAPAAAAAAGGPVASRPDSSAVRTILIVDDDTGTRELIERFLQREGYRVLTATDGPAALHTAREQRPSAITLDVLMPGMDGWAVLRELKADPAVADIPVIMVSMVDDRSIGYALGAADYLTKPIDRERLLAAIRRHRVAPTSDVLIVEDEPQAREMLRRTLERDGWRVTEAENGRTALEKLDGSDPAVIVLDLMMPEMDGFEFVMQLRREPTRRRTPIIVVTAKDLTEDDRRRLHGNVERILRKGAYRLDDLLREIAELVGEPPLRAEGTR